MAEDPTGSLTNASGTIAAANVSQQILAANSSRSYLFIQNPSSAEESLHFEFGGVAVPAQCYDLVPGGSLTFEDRFIPSGTVNVRAATMGHPYICKVH